MDPIQMKAITMELNDKGSSGVNYSKSSDDLERHMGGVLAASSFKKKAPQDICKFLCRQILWPVHILGATTF